MKQRLGKFKVAGFFIREIENLEPIRALMQDVVVYSIDHDLFNDIATYYAYHPSFDPIERGDEFPLYDCVLTMNTNENAYLAEWRKI